MMVSLAVKQSQIRRRRFRTAVAHTRLSRYVVGARLTRRNQRAFFLSHTTHQMKTAVRACDLLAASATALGIVTWGALFTLLAG